MARPVSDPLPTLACAQASIAAAEPILATATADTDRFVLLEDGGPWARRAVEGAPYPEEVARHLARLMAEVPGLRIQLIRRPRRTGRRLYVVRADRGTTFVRELPAVQRVMDLESEALLGDGVPQGMDPSPVPLVLVCVHGRRDACCARLGSAVYQQLEDEPGLDVWQTSHLGGHRFAPTLLCLPSGACHGRLTSADLPGLADAIRAERIWSLDQYRGRTRFSAVAQAAEHFVRRERNLLGLHDVTPQSVAGSDPFRVRVAVRDDEAVDVGVRAQTLDASCPKGCGDAPTAVSTFVRVP